MLVNKKIFFALLFFSFFLGKGQSSDDILEVSIDPYISLNEAFLEDTLTFLTYTTDINSQIKAEEEITQDNSQYYTFTKEDFDRIFPYNYQKEFLKPDFYVGQIISTQRKKGIGTGILIDIEEQGDKIIGRGLTALHTFVDFKNGILAINPPNAFTFIQGNRSIEGDVSKSNFHSSLKIRKIYFLKEKTKDICLFEGTLEPNKDLYRTAQIFLKFLKEFPFPNISEREISLEGDLEGVIYHYPLGKTERCNTGPLLKSNKEKDSFHKINTLFGSSGAPIFVDEKLIGIHLGTLSRSVKEKLKIVTPQGFLTQRMCLHVASMNRFAKISSQDIKNLLSGAELFSVMYSASDDGEEEKKYLDNLTRLIKMSYVVRDIGGTDD